MRGSGQRLPLGSWEGIRWIRLRVAFLGICLLAGLGVVLGRAIHLQVVQQDWLGGLAKGQYARQLDLSPHRGVIVDRGGGTLASSVEVDSIFVDPQLLGATVEARRDAFFQVAEAAGLSRERAGALAAKLETPGSRFFWLARKVSPSVSQKVRALAVPGVGFVKEAKRFYPQRELAAPILGFVGADGHGLEGVERSFDQELRGQGARLAALRDARGRALLSEASVPTELRTGATLSLTLDRTLQYLVERALAQGMREQQARGAMAVVLDVETGEILASASLPTFNPNVGPTRRTREGARNRVVTDPFEPGSTMKPFLLAGALDQGVISETSAFDCENGVWQVGRHRIHDSRRYGKLTPPEMLKVSSNICMGKVAQRLGADSVEAIYRSFGFGGKSGVDLPGEAGGLVGPIRGEIGLVTASFGQGPIMATALQLATGTAALGNGGLLLRPYLVKSVVASDGRVLHRGEREVVGHAIRKETAERVLRWMELVVQKGGTGTLGALEDYPVAAKTGTSQKVDPGTGRYGKERIASFVGLVPADAPRLSIVVILDEPQNERYGGRAAAPVFREIASGALASLGIPSSTPRARPLAAPPSRQDVEVAEGFIAEGNEEEGSGDGEGVRLPDLRGLGVRAAIQRLGELGLEVGLVGSGRVVSHAPPPWAQVERGSKVTLELEGR